ncbi:hypothetical protein GCM10020000_43050 [Streptomyces olivoverticillatus]
MVRRGPVRPVVHGSLGCGPAFGRGVRRPRQSLRLGLRRGLLCGLLRRQAFRGRLPLCLGGRSRRVLVRAVSNALIDSALLAFGLLEDAAEQRLAGVRGPRSGSRLDGLGADLSTGLGASLSPPAWSPVCSPAWAPAVPVGSGTSGMDMAGAGRSWALAMPLAPTAAITPTPRTAPLRAIEPPRCLATRCLPRAAAGASPHCSSPPRRTRGRALRPDRSNCRRDRGGWARARWTPRRRLLSFRLAYRVS